MNYLHAFHAGNHTEIFKHSALALLVERMKQKSSPFVVIDTHAGAGLYDLDSDEARRTGEAEEGIRRIYERSTSAAKPYLDIVRSFNTEWLHRYPGSPLLIKALLREQDRLVACEMNSDVFSQLKLLFKGSPNVNLHCRDGYEAMQALVPPAERRGVVFIDPPFEKKDEVDTIINAVVAAHRKWPTGIYVIWYPIKDQSFGRTLLSGLASAYLEKLLSAEFVPFPTRRELVAGSGLVICNSPWQFDAELKELLSELMVLLQAKEGVWSVKAAT